MRKILSILMLGLLLLTIVGCQSSKVFNDNDMSAEDMEYFDAKSLSISEMIINAIKDNDYEKFVKYLDKELKDKMPKAQFTLLRQAIEEEAGKISEVKFLTILAQPLTRDYIFVVKLIKPIEKPDGQKELLVRERLFFVSYLTMEDEIKIANLGFK